MAEQEEIFGGGHMSVAAAKELLGISTAKVYRALLTQSGTDAPVATVLENTLGGTVTWVYLSAGQYEAQGNGLFAGTAYSPGGVINTDLDFAGTTMNFWCGKPNGNDSYFIGVGTNDGTSNDEKLSNTLIEIFVKP